MNNASLVATIYTRNSNGIQAYLANESHHNTPTSILVKDIIF